MKSLEQIMSAMADVAPLPYPHLLTGDLDEFLNTPRPMCVGELYLFSGLGAIAHQKFMTQILTQALEPQTNRGTLLISTNLVNDLQAHSSLTNAWYRYVTHPTTTDALEALFTDNPELKLVVVPDLDGIRTPSEYLRNLRNAAKRHNVLVVVGVPADGGQLTEKHLEAMDHADKARVASWACGPFSQRLANEADRTYFVDAAPGKNRWTFYQGKCRNVYSDEKETRWVTVTLPKLEAEC